MGNLLFWVLHIMALIFGFVFLFITIPAHLIYCAVRRKREDIPTLTQVVRDKKKV